MKAPLDRRGALGLFAALASLPVLATRLSAQEPRLSQTRFQPPAGPMLFRRVLVRELPDGKAIEVSRSFRVRFLREGDGFRVEGTQVASQVSAPEQLQALARMEEERVESGLFPMLLDAHGIVIAGPQGSVPVDISGAVREALAQIADSGGSGLRQASGREFVLGLQFVATRITSLVPPNLFAGLEEIWFDEHELPLPDGGRGTVSVRFEDRVNPASGLLDRATREVVTRVGGSSRRSIEEWTLAKYPEGGR